MGITGIFESWRCFGKNPMLATRVLIAMVVLPSNPVSHVLDLEKEGYLEDTRTLAMGTAMLYSIAFAVSYSFLYMTYGLLWI
ncbi:MAG: hypothetical protein IBX41_01085 [Methanophagales archaeon]|nr:hypothetical protein [Methanophagales archaeon]